MRVMKKKPAKKTPMPVLSIPLDLETHKRLQEAADAETRSKAYIGRVFIKRALDDLRADITTPLDGHGVYERD